MSLAVSARVASGGSARIGGGEALVRAMTLVGVAMRLSGGEAAGAR